MGTVQKTTHRQQDVSTSPPEDFTIAEAAKLAPGLSEAQIRKAAATGRLRATILNPPRRRNIGRGRPVKILIDPADLAAFIKGARAQGAAPAADGQS